MNGVHDMGGMHGFGPIVREANEPLFHAAWEARVLRHGRSRAGAGGTSRSMRSAMASSAWTPVDYLRAPYYERWLASLEYNLIAAGLHDQRRTGRQD